MYATAADLHARMQARLIAELSGSDDGEPVAVRVDQALADASAEIDSYLAARFAVPIAPVPGVLIRLACDIAIYRLFETAREDDVKDARRRYEDALKWLAGVVAGDITLDAPEKKPAAGGEGSSDGAAIAVRPATFTGNWGGF